MSYKVSLVDWDTKYLSLRQLRDRVFIQEQHVPQADEWDGKDEVAKHFLCEKHTDEFVGCARLLVETLHQRPVFHIGRVAVLPQYRGQGIGRQIMLTVLKYCKTQSTETDIYLHAQINRQAFYEHIGFIATGDVFMDAGIPHIEMWYK
ncbi:MAG: GNAT family N-acetyltransferase [Moraxellaceae bacterium]|nr:MAG: GNAT family N-acetyltransferase [Moraxellaceae bacterium]